MVKGVMVLGMEDGSSRPLLESTGWLVAHRRNQTWLKQNPVDLHMNSFAGGAALDNAPSIKFAKWLSWSIHLFSRSARDD